MLPRGLTAIALGHAASVALVAGAAFFGLGLDRSWLVVPALGLLVAAAFTHCPRAAPMLGSFALSTAHGSGLMLVPALLPLCASGGSMAGALQMLGAAGAAMVLHAAVMIAITALLAAAARHSRSAWHRRLFRRTAAMRN